MERVSRGRARYSKALARPKQYHAEGVRRWGFEFRGPLRNGRLPDPKRSITGFDISSNEG